MDDNKIDSRLRGTIISYGSVFDNLMSSLKDSIDGFAQSDMAVSDFYLVDFTSIVWSKRIRKNNSGLSSCQIISYPFHQVDIQVRIWLVWVNLER